MQRLDEIARDARVVVVALERRIGPLRADERALFGEAKKWVAMFARERDAILAEKAKPELTPERRFIAEPGGRANLYTAMLRSRFHPGAERVDLALLYEVLAGLEQCERDMLARTPETREPWMSDNLIAVRASVLACRASEAEFAKAMVTGDAADRRKFLMQLATDLRHFTAWEAKFIRAPAHRPARLQYAATTLTLLSERIRAIGGLTGADGDAVAAMIEEAATLQGQRDKLVMDREAIGDAVIVKLDAELASIRKVYRTNFAGKQRAEVDLSLLRRVLCRASSIAIQATDLWQATPNDRTEDFRARTRQQHARYEDEEKAVVTAQSAPRKRR